MTVNTSGKLKKRKRLESEMAKHESTDPDIIAAEIDSQIPICSPSGLPVHVVRSRELRCRRPASRHPLANTFGVAQFTERSRWGASDIDGQTREGERVGTNESNRFRLEEIIVAYANPRVQSN